MTGGAGQRDPEGGKSHGTSQNRDGKGFKTCKLLNKLAGTTGLEPATSCVTVRK